MNPGALSNWVLAHRKVFILLGVTLVAYFAAMNRNQAFLWVIPALLSATLITGFTWPRWLVRKLSVSRSGPSRAEEGETIQFRVVLENHGWLPRFMVEVVDHLPFVGLADTSIGSGQKTLGVLAYLPAGKRQEFDVPVVCEKRGYYRLGPVGLASSFPLGLTEAKVSRNEGVQNLTIYPDVFPILSLPLRGAPSQIHRGGYLLPEGAGAAEFSGLREYRRGDNPRHVHWPTTARLNELMVREYEPLASACLYIALDQAAESNIGLGKESTFEYAVRIAASMARSACTQNIRTRIAGEGRRSLRGLGGSGDGHFQGILDELAVIAADGTLPYAQVLNDIGTLCARGETVVVFLSEHDSRQSATLQALATLCARQVHLFAIVFDQRSFVPAGGSMSGHYCDPLKTSGALMELGAYCLTVRQGDDLVRTFNS